MTRNFAFAAAITTAKQSEAREAELLESRKEQDEILRRLEDSIRHQDEAMQALRKNITSFASGFFFSVAKHGTGKKPDGSTRWSSSALEQAQAYCEALVCHKDRELPAINAGLAAVIHDRFAYGIALRGDELPTDYFVGQRLEWFAPLLEKKLKSVTPIQRIRPSATRKVASLSGGSTLIASTSTSSQTV